MAAQSNTFARQFDQSGWIFPSWFLPISFMILTVIVGVLALFPFLGPFVMASVAIYALRGAKESIQSLSILALLIALNKGLAPIEVSTFRWVILAAAFGRTLWDTFFKGLSSPRILRIVILYALAVILMAQLVSNYPTVSTLKVVTFSVGLISIFSGLHRTAYLGRYWTAWFLTLGTFIVLASIPLYGTTLGYLKNGVGFQGILNHPQTFGPLIAPIAAYISSQVFFGNKRNPFEMIVLGLSWAAVYTSQSRTAFLAVVLAAVIAVVVANVSVQRWKHYVNQAVTRVSSIFLFGLIALFVVIQWDSISTTLSEFLLKGEENSTISESLNTSRSNLIDRSMQNFYSAPITGIGFGIPSNQEFRQIETGFLGIPIGASVEKGFLPSAVLEETGIVGAVFIILLVLTLIRAVTKWGDLSSFWLLITCLLINAGEAIFFSIGGNGLYFWLLMAYSFVSAQKVHEQSIYARIE